MGLPSTDICTSLKYLCIVRATRRLETGLILGDLVSPVFERAREFAKASGAWRVEMLKTPAAIYYNKVLMSQRI